MQSDTSLKLRRILIENYKSIRVADLEKPGNLIIFIGKNNSGKSNFLDALYFLKQATVNLKAAVDFRGTGIRDLAFQKSDVPVHLGLSFDIPPERRRWLLETIFAGSPLLSPNAASTTSFLNPLNYRFTFAADQFQEELTTGHPIPDGQDVCLLRIAGNLSSHTVYWPKGDSP